MKDTPTSLRWIITGVLALLAIAIVALWPRFSPQQPTAQSSADAQAKPQIAPAADAPAPEAKPAVAAVQPAPVAAVPAVPQPEPPRFPGEKTGKPWLDIPEWKLLAPRERIVRLMQQPFGIQHSGQVHAVELAKDELYYSHIENPRARVTSIPAQADVEGVLREAEAVKAQFGHLPRLVLYPPGTPRAERSDRNRLIVSEQVLMEASDENAAVASAKESGIADAAPMSAAPGFVLGNDHRFAGSAIVAAADLDTAQGVKTSRPMLAYQSAKKSIPIDPLLSKQWHLNKVGAAQVDINVFPVWDDGRGGTLKGNGIKVAVVDDGLEILHPDLAANCPDLSTQLHYNWNGAPGADQYDPTPNMPVNETGDDHGTSCAGLIGASENFIGGVGVAPAVQLLGFRLIAGTVTAAQEAEAMGLHNDQIQIKSNSWGAPDGPNAFYKLDPVLATAMKNAADTGRGGLGVIMPWAAGNKFDKGDQACHDGYVGNIHHIPVGLVAPNGKIANYSERGSSLIVSAPADKVYTTDLTGSSGANRPFTLTGASTNLGTTRLTVADSSDVYADYLILGPEFEPGTTALKVDDKTNTITLSKPAVATITNGSVSAYDPSGDGDPAGIAQLEYTGAFNGTSAATPVVSGVVALMLQAKPTLGWRDVAEILLRSSQQLDPASKEWGGWVTRDGGQPSIGLPIKHHHAYGGGSVDAEAAVSLARRWTNLEPRGTPMTKGGSTFSLQIPDKGQYSTPFDFTADTPTRVEQVEVVISLTHQKRGDVWITLRSPSGAVSTLKAQEARDTNANGYDQFTFTSNRHWGESSKGIWTVTVGDAFTKNTGTLTNVAITLHGVPTAPVAWDSAPGSTPDPYNVLAAGSPVFFNVSATGGGEISYRWLKNGVVIPNATGPDLDLPYVTSADAGNYVVEASNAVGTVSSSFAVGVVSVPVDRVALTGKPLSLAGTFTTPPAPKKPATLPRITYQWVKDGNDLSNGLTTQGSTVAGATLAKLDLTNCQETPTATDAGAYQLRVSLGSYSGMSVVCNVDIGVKSEIGLTGFPTDLIVGGPITPIDLNLLHGINGSTAITFSPNLPAGLTYNPNTGLITGTPMASVTNLPIKITAVNAAGTTTKTLILNVAPLPPKAVGTFEGLIDRVDGLFPDSVHGGEFNFTVSSSGAASGLCVLGPSISPGTTTVRDSALFRFTGQMVATLNQDPTISFRVAATGQAAKAGQLTFTINRTDGSVTGTFKPDSSPVTTVSAHGYRVTKNTSIGARHTFFLDPITPATTSEPQGPVVGSLAITGNGQGVATFRLPDNTLVMETVYLGPQGEVYLHHAEPKGMVTVNGGSSPSQVIQSLVAMLTITEQPAPGLDTVHGTGTYLKKPPAARTREPARYYNAGFDFGFTNTNILTAQGSEYRLTPGVVQWGFEPGPLSAKFTFEGGNIEGASLFRTYRSSCEPTVSIPQNSTKGQPINPRGSNFIYTINDKGEVFGSFFPYTLMPNGTASIRRSVATFYGVISLGDYKARGLLIVPQTPLQSVFPGNKPGLMDIKTGNFELR